MPGDPTPGSLAQKDATTLGNMICRDFLRGVCYRAENCKFLHSEQHAPVPSSQLPVCRDYQNGTCNRRNCKYAHIFSPSGFYDPVTMTAVPQGGCGYTRNQPNNPQNNDYNRQQPPPSEMADQRYEEVFKTRAGPNDPLCKDFQHGFCQRGENCRFKHISYIQEPAPMAYHTDPNIMPMELPRHYPYNSTVMNGNGGPASMLYPLPEASTTHSNYSSIQQQQQQQQPPPSSSYSTTIPTKRSYLSDPTNQSSLSNGGVTSSTTTNTTTNTNKDSSELVDGIEMLRNENARLRDEIESLKNELSRYQYPSRSGGGGAGNADGALDPNNPNQILPPRQTTSPAYPSPHAVTAANPNNYNK